MLLSIDWMSLKDFLFLIDEQFNANRFTLTSNDLDLSDPLTDMYTYTSKIRLRINRSITHRAHMYTYYHAKSINYSNTRGESTGCSTTHQHSIFDAYIILISEVIRQGLFYTHAHHKFIPAKECYISYWWEMCWCNKYLPWILTRFIPLEKEKEKKSYWFINCPMIVWRASVHKYIYIYIRELTHCVFDVRRWSTSIN